MATNNESNTSHLGNVTPPLTASTDADLPRSSTHYPYSKRLIDILSQHFSNKEFLQKFSWEILSFCVENNIDLDTDSTHLLSHILFISYKFDVFIEMDDVMADGSSRLGFLMREFYRSKRIATSLDLTKAYSTTQLKEALVDIILIGCNIVRELDLTRPGYLESIHYPDPPEDLTEEGIEPNPGPVHIDADIDPPVRHNRYRAGAKVSLRQKKEIQTEIKLYNKLLSQARRDRLKTTMIDYDVAQIGERELDPPTIQDLNTSNCLSCHCTKCGTDKCNCMVNCTEAISTSSSIVQAIIRFLDSLTKFLRPDVAQVGVLSWLAGTQPTIDKADTLITEATERIQALPTAESIRSMISETIKTILDSDCGFLPISIRSILVTLLTVTGLYIIYRMGVLSYELLILPTKMILDAVYRGDCLLTVFRQFCTDDSSHNDSTSPQLPLNDTAQIGVDAVASHLPSAFALVSTLLVTYIVGKVPGRDNTAYGMLSKMGSVPRTAGGIFEIFTWTHKAVIVMWDWIKVKILGFNPDELDGAIPEISRWMKDVEDLTYAPTREAICSTYDGRYKAITLYTTGNNLIRKYHSAMTPNLRQAMTNWMREAARIKNLTETCYPETKAIRSVPLALWMVGESQIGKSRLQYLISTELCLEAGIQDAKDQLYPRNIEMEFWDGYQGQFVTIYDDFGQMKDSSANPNLEFFEIIRTVGPFPCPLHMADISQKGTTDFRSKVVIASTNAMDLKIESLTYPDAVWNRLTQSWYIEVKPEYLIQNSEGIPLSPHRLNLKKVIDDSPILNGKKWAINPYIYDFIKFDARFRNQQHAATGERVGWDTFIAILKEDLISRKNHGLALDEFLQAYIDDRRNTAQIGEEPTPTRSISEESVYFDPIASTASMSFAQCGVPPSYTLEDLRQTLSLDPNPDLNVSELDILDYRTLLHFEIEELDNHLKPSVVQLTNFEPTIFPPQQWQAAVIYFYRMKNPTPSKVKKTLDFVKKMASSTYNRLEPMARSFMEGLGTVVEYFKEWFLSSSKSSWFLIGGSLVALGVWAENRHRIQEEEAKQKKEQDKLFSRPRLDVGSPDDTHNIAESDTRNHQPRVRPQPRTTTLAKPTLVSNIAEMGQSTGQMDVIAKVRRQQYHLTAVYHDGSRIECGTITNIIGQIYIMPYHFYLRLKSHVPMEIIMVNHMNPLVILTRPYSTWIDGPVATLSDHDDLPRDICVFAIKEIHRGKDIINHFASQDDIAKMMDRTFDAILSGIDLESGKPIPSTHGGECTLQPENVPHRFTMGDTLVRTTRVAIHKIPTKVGDCGKIISVNSDAVSGRIFGIHISGNKSGINHAQVISREELKMCVDILPSTAQCGHGFDDLKPSPDPFNCGLLHLGEFPIKIPQASRTNIVKSTLHGIIQEPLTRPAVLRPTEVVIDGIPVMKDPLLEGAKKAGLRCGYVDPHILESAEIDVRNLIHSQLRSNGPEPRVLTFEEAIKGIPNDELFSPVNRTTSPGFPYSLQPRPPGFAGKTFWLGKGDEWALDTPQAKALLDDCLDLERACANNQPTDILWIDTLKDERLPHAKVDIAKTRIISNGPMHYNIVFRKYFLSLMAHIRHNRILNGVAIGIDVWSSEWHHLALHLISNSQHIIDGDFTNYDGTLMDQLMWSVFRIFNSFYDDEHSTLRYNLWHAACYATRYNQGQIYQCTHSLPSGFPATAEANSVYELILFRCAFIKIAVEAGFPHLANMEAFNRLVRIVTYGDDNLLSISHSIIDWFNMHSLVQCMASFGMTYTTAQKTTNYERSRTIDDVSFLKRYFRKVDTGFGLLPMYTCPADLNTRLDILNWTKYKKLGSMPEEADTITTVLQELAVHGKEIYDRESKRVIKAAIDHGITGFIQLSLMDYLTKITTGDLPRFISPPTIKCVPHRCDLATDRQISDVSKAPSSAIDGRCVAIQPYTLGSHEAAPQYPRDRQSGQ